MCWSSVGRLRFQPFVRRYGRLKGSVCGRMRFVLFLSVHAVRQMKRRNITRAEVVEAIEQPDTTYPSEDYPGERIVILGRTLSGRRLKIVTEAHNRECVITVADRDGEE